MTATLCIAAGDSLLLLGGSGGMLCKDFTNLETDSEGTLPKFVLL